MSDTPKRVKPFVIVSVIVLCGIACALTLLLPADSLVVDLIYQGF
jgi:hypothetical protein